MKLVSSSTRRGPAQDVRSGFTLIELLVVIAIIGILSSVVLASLNQARNKGADAAIKSDLNNSRAAAELYYDNTSNSYAAVCTSAGGVLPMKTAATSASGGTVTCSDGSAGWAMIAPLKATSGTYWCVDSTGTSTQKTTAALVAGTNTYTCPAS